MSISTIPTFARPTAPLPWPASDAVRRLELALADRIVANFDDYGSLWGFDTVGTAEAEIVAARVEGAVIEEWETADRDGQPLHVVRVVHPKWGTDIRVASTWKPSGRAVFDMQRILTRYSIASKTVARLSAMDARSMSGAQFDLLADAQDELAMRRQQLADAGQLHLIDAAA